MGRRKLTPDERSRGKSLGQMIARARMGASLTQASLAMKAHVDVDALRGLEQGRYAHPSFYTVMNVARILEISPEQLLPKNRKK